MKLTILNGKLTDHRTGRKLASLIEPRGADVVLLQGGDQAAQLEAGRALEMHALIAPTSMALGAAVMISDELRGAVRQFDAVRPGPRQAEFAALALDLGGKGLTLISVHLPLTCRFWAASDALVIARRLGRLGILGGFVPEPAGQALADRGYTDAGAHLGAPDGASGGAGQFHVTPSLRGALDSYRVIERDDHRVVELVIETDRTRSGSSV